MCPHLNGDQLPNDPSQMVQVELNGKTNGVNGHAKVNGKLHPQDKQRLNPYAPRASDFLSNISNFSIIESTLRGVYHVLAIVNPPVLIVGY